MGIAAVALALLACPAERKEQPTLAEAEAIAAEAYVFGLPRRAVGLPALNRSDLRRALEEIAELD